MRQAAVVITALATSIAAAACSPGPVEEAPTAEPASESGLSTSAAASEPGSFEGIAYHGDGCPEGTTTTAISPDGQAFTTVFSAFTASAGPTTDAGERSRGCLMQARVEVPAGWSYRLAVDHRGYFSLEAGVRGTRQSVYVVPGNPPRAPAPAIWSGELQDNFNDRDLGDDGRQAWSPCGGGETTLIATRISVEPAGTGASGLLALDTTDAELSWRRCY